MWIKTCIVAVCLLSAVRAPGASLNNSQDAGEAREKGAATSTADEARIKLSDDMAALELANAVELATQFDVVELKALAANATEQELHDAALDASAIDRVMRISSRAWPGLLLIEAEQRAVSAGDDAPFTPQTEHLWNGEQYITRQLADGQLTVEARPGGRIDWESVFLFNGARGPWIGSSRQPLSDLLRHGGEFVEETPSELVYRVNSAAGGQRLLVAISKEHYPQVQRLVHEVMRGMGGDVAQRVTYRVEQWTADGAKGGSDLPWIVHRDFFEFPFQGAAIEDSSVRRTTFMRRSSGTTSGSAAQPPDWSSQSLRGRLVDDRPLRAEYEVAGEYLLLEGKPFRASAALRSPADARSMTSAQFLPRGIAAAQAEAGGGAGGSGGGNWRWWLLGSAAILLTLGGAVAARSVRRGEKDAAAVGAMLLVFGAAAAVVPLLGQETTIASSALQDDLGPDAEDDEASEWLLEGEHVHDFGRIPFHRAVIERSHVFRLKNASERTLTIVDLHSSCTCFGAEASRDSVPPGETVEVSVKLKFVKPGSKSGRIRLNLGEAGIEELRVRGDAVSSAQMWAAQQSIVLKPGEARTLLVIAVGFDRPDGPPELTFDAPHGVAARFEGWTKLHGAVEQSQIQPRWHGSISVRAEGELATPAALVLRAESAEIDRVDLTGWPWGVSGWTPR